MADDDLRINTLHRFAKHSPRLILHEYSHCEIPAGCGGVVLRWIDPDQGRPVAYQILSAATRGALWLDGAPLSTSAGMLRAGMRLIALHVTAEQPGTQLFALTVGYAPASEVDLVSAGAPHWRCTRTKPADPWTEPGFDDTGWTAPLLAKRRAIARQDSWIAPMLERARERGQHVFEFERELWLRVRFTVEEVK